MMELRCVDNKMDIDHGSEFIKSGFAGGDSPRAVFHSIVGRLRHPRITSGLSTKLISPMVKYEAPDKAK